MECERKEGKAGLSCFTQANRPESLKEQRGMTWKGKQETKPKIRGNRNGRK